MLNFCQVPSSSGRLSSNFSSTLLIVVVKNHPHFRIIGFGVDSQASPPEKRERGPRYFRCKPGYGISLPVADVERVPEEDDDEGAGSRTYRA